MRGPKTHGPRVRVFGRVPQERIFMSAGEVLVDAGGEV